MAQFPILRLTHAGQEMAGMSQGGGKLTFVRVELGDGQLKEEDSIEALTDLKRSVMQLPLQGYLNEGNGKVRLRFVIDNSALTVGFHNREVGIFAKIDNGAERLYAYTNAGNYADWIPSKETPIDGDIVDLHIVIGNAANVTIQTVSGAYATKIELEEHRTAAELDHPNKSVKRKHLADNVYTLPAPEATNAARFVGGDHKVHDVTPSSIGAYSKNETNNLLAQKAPLASPALTGTPTVPTAGKGTNNGQIASTAFVSQAITALVNSAPGTLDTLQELAAALGNNANFATTVTNALAGKLGKTEKAASAGNSDTLGGQSLQWIIDQINAAKTGIIAGNLAQNGWVRFTNGLIVQWGVGLSVNKEEERVVDFPIKFPSLCFGVWVTTVIEASKNHLSAVNGEFQVISANTAQCHLFFQLFNPSSQPAVPSILAIGI